MGAEAGTITYMSKITLNLPAPEFEIQDMSGRDVSLSDYHQDSNVLLVFNRGFT